MFGALLGWLDVDFDPLPKGIQESEKAVVGEPFHAASDEGGYFRLIEAKKFGSLRLGELSLGNQIPDSQDEFGFGKSQFGVRQAKVGEHVPAPTFDPIRFCCGRFASTYRVVLHSSASAIVWRSGPAERK